MEEFPYHSGGQDGGVTAVSWVPASVHVWVLIWELPHAMAITDLKKKKLAKTQISMGSSLNVEESGGVQYHTVL